MRTDSARPSAATGQDTVRLSRHRGVLSLAAAKLISTTGSWTNTVAMPWFVLTTSGSPAKMSFVLAAQVAGIVLLGLPGSAVLSRIGVRRTMLLGDAARVPLVAMIPLLYHFNLLAFPLLLALVFVTGGFTASYVAEQRMAIPQMVGEDTDLVGRASSLLDGATRLGNLAGPVTAGILIGVTGAVNVLWFDAATFLVSFLIVLMLIRPNQAAVTTEPNQAVDQTTRPRWVPRGFHAVANDPVLRWMGLSLLFVGITYPLLMVTLPVLTTTRFDSDPRIYGGLVSASGLGLALGSVLAVTLLGRWPITTLGGIAAVGAMGPLWFLLLPLSPVGLGAVFVVSGLFIPTFSACLSSHFLLYTAPTLRPQVMTGVTATENTAGFTAYAAGGLLVTAIGLQGTLLLVALTGAACSIALVVAVLRIRASPPDRKHR